MTTPIELIEGVNIISQYESVYYPDNYGKTILLMIVFFLVFCVMAGILITSLINQDEDFSFYITITFIILISFILTIGLFCKAKSIDTYNITEYKVTITDTAKYNEVNDKLYIIKEDHGVYDVYLKTDMLNSDK